MHEKRIASCLAVCIGTGLAAVLRQRLLLHRLHNIVLQDYSAGAIRKDMYQSRQALKLSGPSVRMMRAQDF